MMGMYSVYLECDEPGCKAVFDRRAPDDHRDQKGIGTFSGSRQNEIYAAAQKAGWQIRPGGHFCPAHRALSV